MKSDWWDSPFVIVPGIVAGLLLITMLVGVVVCSTRTYHHGIVKTVGACDRYGKCGVLLEDGKFCLTYYPVVGTYDKVWNCQND